MADKNVDLRPEPVTIVYCMTLKLSTNLSDYQLSQLVIPSIHDYLTNLLRSYKEDERFGDQTILVLQGSSSERMPFPVDMGTYEGWRDRARAEQAKHVRISGKGDPDA
jgi:hypothetical protein